MATLIPLSTQYFDAIGEPLEAGKMYFYDSGTLDLHAIYTREDEAFQLANPVVLSSEGRIPTAGVWCNGSYRIILKDSAGVTVFDLDDVNLYNPVNWTGLTASIADINAVAGSLGTPGTVVANKAVVVGASKDIASFGVLTGATLRATTAVRTPQINDVNNVAAITIPAVASQVNSITITPAVTAADPSIMATGADSNIDLIIDGKGTGGVNIAGLLYPTADGSAGQVMTTSGSGTLSFASIPLSSQIVKQVTQASTQTYSAVTSVIPADDTIPQITEGTEILTCSITPSSASSTLLIFFIGDVSSSLNNYATTALFRDAGANAITASGSGIPASNDLIVSTTMFASVSAASTALTTFRIRVGRSASGTVWVNGNAGRKYGGVSNCSLIILEI